MSKIHHLFELNTYELSRRAGEMREYELDIAITQDVGVELICVPAGDIIEIDVRLESVTEGILLSADIYATAKGECIRCLDPVEIVIDRRIQELYNYEPTNERGQKIKKATMPKEDELENDDELMMQGEIMDLEPAIRDAIVLSLPINPLCSQDCAGLCPECGEKWANLPSDHAHVVVDARWATLGKLGAPDPDFKI